MKELIQEGKYFYTEGIRKEENKIINVIMIEYICIHTKRGSTCTIVNLVITKKDKTSS